MATTEYMRKLYRINDALTELANEFGVPVTEEWEDSVLNDLTLHVADKFGITDPQQVAVRGEG